MAAQGFHFAAGRPVELNFPDVTADLHTVGTGVHAQSAPDSPRYSNEPFHPAEVVFRAESHGAAKVGGRIDLGKIAFEHDIRLGRDKLQNDPGQLAVADEQV